ncbi:MAG: creatininase family protein [Vicinamibacterales bacterium]
MYKLEELTWPQIDALDRQRTLFILPVGMIEEHGPHWVADLGGQIAQNGFQWIFV